MDARVFFEELWAYVGTLPPSLPKKLVFDLYEIGWRIDRGQQGDWWECLCWCAKDVAKYRKGRLPDCIHNRMVLGDQNKHTVEYVKKWGV